MQVALHKIINQTTQLNNLETWPIPYISGTRTPVSTFGCKPARYGCAEAGWRSRRARTSATCSARPRPTLSPAAPAVSSTTTTRASLKSGSMIGSISTTILTPVYTPPVLGLVAYAFRLQIMLRSCYFFIESKRNLYYSAFRFDIIRDVIFIKFHFKCYNYNKNCFTNV